MKRIFALLLCALLLLGAAPGARAAVGETVYIHDADELRALASLCSVDSFSAGKTFVLAADIDLEDAEFAPIPVFAGTFDGNGKTVRGLKISAAASVTGFFRCLTETALVERLFLEGEVCPGGEARTVGGVAGENRGTIRGCGFTGTVRGSRAVVGVAGSCAAGSRIESCTTAGLVSGEHGVGGVAGGCAGELRACVNYASVGTEAHEEQETATLDLSLSAQAIDLSRSTEELLDVTDIGGVVGWCSGAVCSCTNAGEVGYPHVGYNVGGVAGRVSGSAEDCTNRAPVCGRKDVGGVVGQLEPAAGWSFSGGKLDELRGLLSQLQENTDKLLADTGAQNAATSAALTTALQALSETGSAAQALTDEARGWLDSNLETVNTASARLSQAIDGLAPVFSSLKGVTAALPQTVQALRDAEDALRRASTDAYTLPGSIQAARADMDAALLDAQSAAADLSAAAAQLRAGLGDPTAIDAGIAQLSTGLGTLSTLFGRVAEDMQLISDALDDRDAGGDAAEELAQLRTNLARAPESFMQTAQALADLSGGLSALGGELDADALGKALGSLGSALGSLGKTLGEARSVLGDLGAASTALAAARPELSTAMRSAEDAAAYAEEALRELEKATAAASALLDSLAGQEPLAFTQAGERSAAENSLYASLQRANAALSTLAGEVRDTRLLSDIQAASDSLFALTDFLVGLYAAPTEKDLRSYVEDVSDTERSAGGGLVSGCRSAADVSADTNVGGVVGAVTLELEFDREDEWNLSGLLSGSMKYRVYAVVRDCSGVGSVYAKKDAAGGVVGRMDYGAVLSCEAGGAASAGGSYAGGIAGWCLGTIRACLARTQLDAASYVGGIAGLGHDLFDCRSLPQSLPEAEYCGAIAGDADGQVAGNLYAESTVGAVNGMSFTGQAEPVPYETLLAESGGSTLLGSVTVQFVSEDGVVRSVEVPFGGRVEKLPAVPDRDGGVWVWDDFNNTALYRSLTVGGRYVKPIATLSVGGEVPDCLAEGSFHEGQSLRLAAYEPTGETAKAVLDAGTVWVEDYEGPLTLRLRQPAEGALYLADESGTLRETAYTRDGSYIVFTIDSGGSYVLTEKTQPIWPYFAAGGAAVLVIGGGLLLLLRARKKKRTAV